MEGKKTKPPEPKTYVTFIPENRVCKFRDESKHNPKITFLQFSKSPQNYIVFGIPDPHPMDELKDELNEITEGKPL